MGRGSIKKCHKCGYEIHCFNGIGMLFPLAYEETVQKAKDGEFGENIEVFYRKHEDGAINAERVTLCCDGCGFLTNEEDLTMYIPKSLDSKEFTGKTKEEMDLIKKGQSNPSPWNEILKECYDEYEKYDHICKKCGEKMRVVGEGEELRCPICKTVLDEEGFHWD